MGSFGSISLANKFGIVLGILIIIAFGAGLIKLWVLKRRLRKHVKLDEEAAKNPRIEKKHAGRENDPRYLFGVRALEKGHFGGVAQTSRPNSVAPSEVLSSSNPSLNSTAESNKKHPSIPISSLEQSPKKQKPSPLSIHPANLLSSGPKTHSPISPESRYVVSPVTPTIPATWSLPILKEPETQSSGLSFPKATSDPLRPTSYLPKLDFSEQKLETSFFISTPAGSVRGERSKSSTATTEISYPASIATSRSSSPVYATSPIIPIPPRSSLRSHRSTLSLNKSDLPATPQRTEISKSIPVPPIPAAYELPERKQLVSRRPSLADSGYGSPIKKTYVKTKSSDSISLAILTGNSTISSFPKFDEIPPQVPSDVQMPEPVLRGRNPNKIPTPHRRQTSSTSLSRTHDSLSRHSHKMSRERSASNRRSKQRDQVHYDPTPHHRNRGGSIQGRAVDFSQPRESPFSDHAAAMYKHSPSSSSSSENSIISYYTTSKSSVYVPETFDLQTLSGGSRLRYTHDNFGYSPESGMEIPSVISLKDSAPRQELQTAVAQVQRLKPVRVSSHDGEFLAPGLGLLETHSTSTSPIVERFPRRI